MILMNFSSIRIKEHRCQNDKSEQLTLDDCSARTASTIRIRLTGRKSSRSDREIANHRH